MPGISGWEVARRLRAGVGGTELLLIAVTGVQGREAEDSSSDAGFDHHILKPADPGEVFADLAAFVQGSPLCPPVGSVNGEWESR
ncbi:MAG TPA: hypothetical protein VM597_06055 [Gemmataceae bacterium]|jgi:CheY-like chemotaxis protein|nr:hypothetical protein [Gemmataceae bacterium]